MAINDMDREIELSILDIKKISRRVGHLSDEAARWLSHLCKSADDCWDYPQADERYELLLGKMGRAEAIENELSKIQDLLTEVLAAFNECASARDFSKEYGTDTNDDNKQ